MLMQRRDFLKTSTFAVAAFATEACTPTELAWAAEIENIAKVAAQAAGAAFSIVDPAVGPLISEIETAFGTITNVAQQVQSNPATTVLGDLSDAITAADQQVANLEVEVKNPGTSSTIVSLSALLSNCLADIVADIPSTVTSRMSMIFATNASKQLVIGKMKSLKNLKSHGTAHHWTAKQYKAQVKKLHLPKK